MALVEDVLKGNAATAMGVGVIVLAFPFVFPGLRMQWAEAVKAGAKLFFEAEGGAEGDIMDRLADSAVDDMVRDLSHGTEDERRQAVAADIQKFKATAHRRSQRYGWNEQDREARYRRHLGTLRNAISDLRTKQSGADAEILDELASGIEAL